MFTTIHRVLLAGLICFGLMSATGAASADDLAVSYRVERVVAEGSGLRGTIELRVTNLADQDLNDIVLGFSAAEGVILEADLLDWPILGAGSSVSARTTFAADAAFFDAQTTLVGEVSYVRADAGEVEGEFEARRD